MEIASPKSEEKPRAKITLAYELEANPDKAMQSVVMMPSNPP
jgi:hypothetical protein